MGKTVRSPFDSVLREVAGGIIVIKNICYLKNINPFNINKITLKEGFALPRNTVYLVFLTILNNIYPSPISLLTKMNNITRLFIECMTVSILLS